MPDTDRPEDAEGESIECVWKVVSRPDADEGEDMLFKVAFDWKSELETRKMLPWDEVFGLITLPISYWRGHIPAK